MANRTSYAEESVISLMGCILRVLNAETRSDLVERLRKALKQGGHPDIKRLVKWLKAMGSEESEETALATVPYEEVLMEKAKENEDAERELLESSYSKIKFYRVEAEHPKMFKFLAKYAEHDFNREALLVKQGNFVITATSKDEEGYSVALDLDGKNFCRKDNIWVSATRKDGTMFWIRPVKYREGMRFRGYCRLGGEDVKGYTFFYKGVDGEVVKMKKKSKGTDLLIESPRRKLLKSV